ncbi:unnamed protein product [Medioppia subpectinata]|uniref:Uncharacterized protein n=1 Tax=Medioppia subpectinata TaxID=1979941 RepID=A0A7R9QGR7_9ACAR|nr:unnamed protein product [Medioppia subpectinata]CAG2120523.1 unnamed protein product [Medioppia subpectinata]
MAPYCMAKCAMDMFTKCMASELATKRIRINSVVPGMVRTDCLLAIGVSQTDSDKHFESYTNILPVGRYGQPQDIADSILYLASDHAQYINGTFIMPDGGAVAGNI